MKEINRKGAQFPNGSHISINLAGGRFPVAPATRPTRLTHVYKEKFAGTLGFTIPVYRKYLCVLMRVLMAYVFSDLHWYGKV